MGVKLSDSEWKIISLLWEKSPRTITQITADLKDETGWTKHTVITLLKRMKAKGAIHFVDNGRAKQYYPDIDQKDAVKQETESFLSKVFKGNVGLMINTLINQKGLSQEEIDELYDILKKAEEQKND